MLCFSNQPNISLGIKFLNLLTLSGMTLESKKKDNFYKTQWAGQGKGLHKLSKQVAPLGVLDTENTLGPGYMVIGYMVFSGIWSIFGWSQFRYLL